MKKIIISTLMLAPFISNAQFTSNELIQTNSNDYNKTYNSADKTFDKELKKVNISEISKKTRINGKRVFCPPVDLDTFLISIGRNPLFTGSNLYAPFMWKDSVSGFIPYGGSAPTFEPVEVQSINQVLDPYAKRYNSAAFNGQPQALLANPWSVDTFGIVCDYFRMPNKPNVVDTLRMSFAKSSQCAGINFGLFAGYSDSVKVLAAKTNYATKGIISTNPASPNVIVKDVYLKTSNMYDTLSNGFNYYKTPVNLQLNSEYAVASVTFISGDPAIIPGDSLSRYNRFRFLTFGQGNGTSPNVVKENQYFAKDDWNMSGHTWTASPFALKSSSSTNQYYYPSIRYSSTTASNILPYQQHWTYWQTTINNASIVAINDVVKLEASILPNPTTDYITITVAELNNSKMNVNISNAMGQTVITKSFDSNKNTISLSNLNSGIYFVNVNVDGKTTTQKIVKQ